METALEGLKNKKEVVWLNENCQDVQPNFECNGKKFVHIKAAQNRLLRFMPYIENVFPETAPKKGIIESELIEINAMKQALNKQGATINGRLLLKDDAHLPIAGSVKARGGIHEVLKVAEELAIRNGMMSPIDNHSIMDSEKFRDFFSGYTIQVGSTGNLGLSIGRMSAKLGFKTIVHMSSDAKAWKKELLRKEGATVIEYDSDYSRAVAEGRRLSSLDPRSHFVDDETSEDLFFGYATAALRLKVQLTKKNIIVDDTHPLVVFIPCGVGGAPGGITFGLKQLFGKNALVYFVEPTGAPCFMLGMASGEYDNISVSDIGIDGRTIADGLAVGRASRFVCQMMDTLVNGSMTVTDEHILEYQKLFYEAENIYLEPSACAGVHGIIKKDKLNISQEILDSATYIIWATGGGLVPDDERVM